VHEISVGTIKFGMLNHDRVKDVVFSLKDWAAKSGDTGPYVMYAYARTQSVLRTVQAQPQAVADLQLLVHDEELVAMIHMLNFWPCVSAAQAHNNPSSVCNFLFDLAKCLSRWFECDECSAKHAKNPNLQAARLQFVRAIGEMLRVGLSLLGIRALDRM